MAIPSHEIDLPVDIPQSPPCPQFRHSLGRINVILGSNGTGKSSLLRHLHSNNAELRAASGCTRICLIVGDRTLRTTGTSTLTRNEAANTDGHLQGLFASESRNDQQLLKSAASILEMLSHDHAQKFLEHSDACNSLRGRTSAEIPERQRSKLDQFASIFSRIFPQINLTFDPVKVTVQCHKYGRTYGPEHLSTGERQVFLLLGRAFLGDQPEFFLVDEPDRNMNAHLAEMFWSTVESIHHPNSVFVYATHLPSFALRQGVDRIFLLNGHTTVRVDDHDFSCLSSSECEALLGSIPAIVTRDRILATEGSEGGLDVGFFEFLTDEFRRFSVIPLGGCERVVHFISGTRVWSRFTTGIRMLGVLDRDFRPDVELDRLRERGIEILPYHEVESMYCHPDLLFVLASKRSAPDYRLSRESIVQRLMDTTREVTVRTAMCRATARLSHTFVRIGVPGTDLDQVGNSADKALDAIRAKSGAWPLEEAYVSAFQEEHARLERSIQDGDVELVLKLVEGKRLLNGVLSLFRMSKSELIAEIHHHVSPDELPDAHRQLRDRLLKAFA